jgi:hypothetical protein
MRELSTTSQTTYLPRAARTAVLSSSLLSNLIMNHMRCYSQHKKGMLDSDGAGCYSGIGLAARLMLFKRGLGFEIVSHCTGEGGGGKGTVDANFGVQKTESLKSVVCGLCRLDIKDFNTLVKALNNHVTRGTINYAVNIDQKIRRLKLEPEKTSDVKKAGLQTVSYKTFSYDAHGFPTEILCYNHSGLGGSPQHEIKASTLWPTAIMENLSQAINVGLSRKEVIVSTIINSDGRLHINTSPSTPADKSCSIRFEVDILLTPEAPEEKEAEKMDRRQSKAEMDAASTANSSPTK